MRYLGYVLYPCIVGYCIYSLLYDTHRSWYSWILSSLVGAVYTFGTYYNMSHHSIGFITMTPQLFINYKLKSVAHMPWRMMVYKSLNTFIDDLFAFVIKMPMLHRLSCFRDGVYLDVPCYVLDIIFFIFLYQRWVYRIDPTRVNEFGYQAQPEPEQQTIEVDQVKDEDDKAEEPLPAPLSK